MIESYQLSINPSRLLVQLVHPPDFDSSVISSENSELFLGHSRLDPQTASIEYPIEEMVSLKELLAQIQPGRSEACSLLYQLFTVLKAGMKNQPVILELEGIYFSPQADSIWLLRAPLVLECWMKRKDDFTGFLKQLLESLDCPSFEICGLLYKAIQEAKSIEAILADLETLYQSCKKRRWFSGKAQIDPFQLKKPVFPDLALRSQNKPEDRDRDEQREMNHTMYSHPSAKLSEGPLAANTAGNWNQDLGLTAQSTRENEFPAGFTNGQHMPFQQANSGAPEKNIPLKGLNDPMEFFSPNPSESTEFRKSQQTQPTASPPLLADTDWEIFRRPVSQSRPQADEAALVNSAYPMDSAPIQQSSPFIPDLDSGQGSSFVQDQSADFEAGVSRASSLNSTLLSPNNTAPAAASEYEPTVLIESLCEPAFLECKGKRYPLIGDEILVGRLPDCQVRLEEQGISGHHARLVCQASRWYIQDLKSTNGTFIGTKQIVRRMRLKEGMSIHFGTLEALFFEQPVLHP